MADKRGGNVPVQQCGHCPGAATAWAIEPGNAMENARRHKHFEWQGHSSIHKHEHADCKDKRPSDIK